VFIAIIVSVCAVVILTLAARVQAAMLPARCAVGMREPSGESSEQVRLRDSVFASGTCRNRHVGTAHTPDGLNGTCGRGLTESEGPSREEPGCR
jgi:hypothetical protein